MLKWSSKQNNFNIYNVAFKIIIIIIIIIITHGGITLHLHTNNLNMIYSSWDIKCDRLKLVILGLFSFLCVPFYSPKNPKNPKFEKMEKLAEEIIILHMCTKNHNHVM